MRIVVIGAGIVGLATAFTLTERGHDVIVLDPDPAGGASRAAAGMLAAVTETEWAQDALHPLMREAADVYPAFIARLTAAAGRAVGYRETATLAVAVDAADRETLTRLAILQQQGGADVERVTGSRARELESSLGPAVSSAMRIAEDHQVDPRQVTAALLSVLGERVRREQVVRITMDAADAPAPRPARTGTTTAPRRVHLASGDAISADAVVAATGLGQVEGVPALPVRPVWGDILRLRVPEALRPLLTHTVRALVRGRSVYLVPREDGTLVVGASVREGGVAGVQAGGVLALLRDAQTVVPGIEECEVIEMIARPRPGSPDATPLIGIVEPRLIVANGFDRHGVLLAPLGARLVAGLIEGHAIDPAVDAAVHPSRFGPANPRPALPDLTPPAVAVLDGAGMKG